MTRAMRFRWAAIAGGAAVCAGAACRGDGKATVDTAIVPPSASLDGDVTDSVEMESEPDIGPPPALLRSNGPDTVIVSRQTPALTKPIDSMTNTEVVVYLRKLAYKRKAKSVQDEWVGCTHAADSTPCTPSESAHVYIQPEAGMNKLPHGSIPPNGVIVARITNETNGLDAAVFGYKARRKTWWIVDDSAGSPRSRYFVRTYSGTGPAIRFVTYSRPFVLCSHAPTTHPRAARAKFWTCIESADDTALSVRGGGPRGRAPGATLASYVRFASFRSAVPMLAAPPPPVFALVTNWVSCGAGCCATAP